jgi:hypothetical protein
VFTYGSGVASEAGGSVVSRASATRWHLGVNVSKGAGQLVGQEERRPALLSNGSGVASEAGGSVVSRASATGGILA